MRFSVEVDNTHVNVWDDSEAHEALDGLLERCDDACHELVLREADLVAESTWLSQMRPNRRTLAEQVLHVALSSAYTTPRNNVITIRSAAEAKVALKTAREPLRILVENSLRDGDFILGVLELRRTEPLYSLMLATPPSPAAVEIVHVGGTGDLAAQAERLAERLALNGVVARMIVLRDSDQRSDPPVKDTAELKRQQDITSLRSRLDAIRAPVRLKVWKKRASENFLPDAYWREYRTLDVQNVAFTDGIDALLNLGRSDRDFVDMGESGKGRKKVPGSLDNRKPYHLSRFREQVKKANRATQDSWAESLETRDHAGELNELLEWMEELR